LCNAFAFAKEPKPAVDRQTQAAPTLLYRAFSLVVVHEKFQNIAISQAQ